MSNNPATRDPAKAAKSVFEAPLTINRLGQLTKLKPDQILSAVLSRVNAHIRTITDQDGSTIGLFSNDSKHKKIGAVAEINKIMGVRKFVNEEYKKSTHEKIMQPIRVIAWNAVFSEKDNKDWSEEERQGLPINNAQLALLRQMAKDMEMLERNHETVIEVLKKLNDKPEHQPYLGLLTYWIGEIAVQYELVIDMVVRNKETKGELQKRLHHAGIPKWAYEKLVKNDLNTNQVTNVTRIFFPRDLRKGIYFLVSELADEKFMENTGNTWLIENGRLAMEVIRNEDLLKELNPKKEIVKISDDADTLGSSIRNEKVFFIPPGDSAQYILELAKTGRTNYCGSPSFASFKLGLRTILECILAVQTGDFKTADTLHDFWNKIVTKKIKPDEVTAKKSVRHIILETEASVEEFAAVIKANLSSAIAEKLIPTILNCSNDHPIVKIVVDSYKAIKIEPREYTTVVKDADGKNVTVHHERYALPPPIDEREFEAHWSYSLEPDGKEEKTSFDLVSDRQRIGVTGVKKDKAKKALSLSSLTIPGARLIKRFEKHDTLGILTKPIGEWLRSFASEDLQLVAVAFIEAQFDNLLVDDDDGGEDVDRGSEIGSENENEV